MCTVNKTPHLNDIHIFSLDNRSWYQVKFTDYSEPLPYLCNHSLAVLTVGESVEKVVIFGGILNFPKDDVSEVGSALSNTTMVGTFHKNQTGGRENEPSLRFQLPDTLKQRKASFIDCSGKAAEKTNIFTHSS